MKFHNPHLYVLALVAVGTALLVTSGCAGPNTPLGAVRALSSSELERMPSLPISQEGLSKSQLAAQPNLELAVDQGIEDSEFKFQVTDPEGIRANHQIHVYYDRFDVTQSLLKMAEVNLDTFGTSLEIKVPRIKFNVTERHKIRVDYRSGKLNRVFTVSGEKKESI